MVYITQEVKLYGPSQNNKHISPSFSFGMKYTLAASSTCWERSPQFLRRARAVVNLERCPCSFQKSHLIPCSLEPTVSSIQHASPLEFAIDTTWLPFRQLQIVTKLRIILLVPGFVSRANHTVKGGLAFVTSISKYASNQLPTAKASIS